MMKKLWNYGRMIGLIPLLVLSLTLGGCGDDGSDGRDGVDGAPGVPGSAVVDISTASDSDLEGVDIVSEITNVTIQSPPVITFTVSTANGLPVIGIGSFWEESNRFVRFTISKLVPGTNGDPDSWVAYTRDTTGDGSTGPDYDTGSLVDHGDGSYTFTFNTDVNAVSGIPYEPALTHRVAGQIGSGSVAMEAQNLVYDFVPAGGAITNTRNIAVMTSCNECHDNLVFHGRRFEVEYCVQCHNPELAINSAGVAEGDMAFMTHKIHNAGTFEVLDGGIDYSEVTYPQELANCRKCHNGDDAATADGDNWKNVPSKEACLGCHEVPHVINATDNSGCIGCHTPSDIEEYHVTPNATENNPNLFDGQPEIAYELIEVTVDGSDVTTIDFRITADGEPLDLNSLPASLNLINGPSFLLAYALPQSGINAPADFNNLGESAAQPISADYDEEVLVCSGGICTAVLTTNSFPTNATMRTVALQGYFVQDINTNGSYDRSGPDIALHTQSVVMTVTGDDSRRDVVSSAKCAACHEIFEGHGGNRVFTTDGGVAVCTVCHVPNLSSGGRTLDVSFPEDTNNFKELVHGIHAGSVRSETYEFVRNRSGARLYAFLNKDDFEEDAYVAPAGTFVEQSIHFVTYPAEISNCLLCHIDADTLKLPQVEGVLETTVRTTGVADGADLTTGDFIAARDSLPNTTDWVNTPVSSSCFYCHDSVDAQNHMIQNGGQLSYSKAVAPVDITNRVDMINMESCATCHGPGRSADVVKAHGLE